MYWCKYCIYLEIFKNVKKMETWIPCHCLCLRNLNKIYMLFFNIKRPLFETIFINHHFMCSSISSCCNHLSSMLMSVKLIILQLELNGIGHKLIFHNYSKFTSNTWYTLICKFEKCKPNPQKIIWYEYI
jgi:hypothetical protein